MDLELINKIDDLITIFDTSEEIKKLKELKEKIYTGKELKQKLEHFNKIKDNSYSNEYITLKKEILNIPEIKEYKTIENELLLLTLYINQKLNTLTKKKGCNHENN